MGSVEAVESVAGLALVFFLPGFALARATFPEWRFRGPSGTVHLLETLTLSLVGSVVLTILLGIAFLNTSVGFQATWSDPVLFAALAALTAVGLVGAWVRGAFATIPPAGPNLEPEGGTEGAFEDIREIDRLRAEERRLRHRSRTLPRDDPERLRLNEEIARVEAQAAEIMARREAEQNAG